MAVGGSSRCRLTGLTDDRHETGTLMPLAVLCPPVRARTGRSRRQRSREGSGRATPITRMPVGYTPVAPSMRSRS